MIELIERSHEKIEGVLFDLDNTLYNREAAFKAWVADYVRSTLPLDSIYDGETINDIVERICAMDPGGYGSKASVVGRLGEVHPDFSGDSRDRVERFHNAFLDYVTLDPRIDRLLTTLSSRSVPFGIVTNGTSRQWDKIDALKLRARASCIIVSDTFGYAKPDPKIFLAAARAFESRPERIIFVGDNPCDDIEGAKSVGMITVWLHRNLPWPDDLAPADYIIDSVA